MLKRKAGEPVSEPEIIEGVVVEEMPEVNRLEDDWAAMLEADGVTEDGDIIEGNTDEEPEQKKQVQVALDLDKVKTAENMIYGFTKSVVDDLLSIPVPDESYRKFSVSLARAICTYYKGGIFEFIAQWQPLLAAMWGTAVFGKAVREGLKIKRLEQQEAIDAESGGNSDGSENQAKAA